MRKSISTSKEGDIQIPLQWAIKFLLGALCINLVIHIHKNSIWGSTSKHLTKKKKNHKMS